MASAQSRWEGDLFVNGNLSAKAVTLPAGTVTDASVAPAAGIQANKLQQQHEPVVSLCNYLTNAALIRLPIHVVFGATAAIQMFRIGAAVACGAATTVTVDLKKNGTSILTATISYTNAFAAYAFEQPSAFTSTSLVAGDVLEVEITAVSGVNLPKGMFAQVIIREDPN